MKPVDLKPGDPCPACGGELRKAPQPTPEMRAHAASRDDSSYRPIPGHYDTASLEHVEEHGELSRCRECGYQARFAPAAEKVSA